jgi:hypothetical protein
VLLGHYTLGRLVVRPREKKKRRPSFYESGAAKRGGLSRSGGAGYVCVESNKHLHPNIPPPLLFFLAFSLRKRKIFKIENVSLIWLFSWLSPFSTCYPISDQHSISLASFLV